jgi:hypothetical protein
MTGMHLLATSGFLSLAFFLLALWFNREGSTT